MKQTLFIILFLSFPFSSAAKDKFWISNKIEIGYGKIFLSEQFSFDKNSFGLGLKFKLSDKIKYKTFYLLENARNNNWKNNHFLGIGFDLKLQ